MSRRLVVVALVAGVTGLAGRTEATPVTSPSQVDGGAPATSAPVATRRATKSTTPRATKAKAKRVKAKSAKAAKLATGGKRSTTRGKAKLASKSKRKPKAKPKATRMAVAAKRSSQPNNMPLGFTWPPSSQMTAASKRCEDELDALGVAWRRASAEGYIVDPIIVPSMVIGGITYTSVYRKPPHKLECQLVRTLAMLGPELRALGVREVRFGSIYRNTMVRVGGVTKHVLSRHALGLAMDVMSFVDEAGRVAVVETDYPKSDTLLLGIEDAVNKSGKFRIVLTPQNDPISHDDHFHIEAAVDYTRSTP